MKICPNCATHLEDNANFCHVCGMNFTGSAQPQMKFDPYDHTAEFDKKDISDNKIIALTIYVMGIVGVLVALLAAGNSPYVSFHIRQYLKYALVETVLGLVAAVLFWTFVIPIVAGIGIVAVMIFRIISAVQICKGEAKEGLLIRKLNFLK